MKNYKKTYQDFWKEVIEKEDGTLNVDQLKKELHDYKILLDEVPKVYDELASVSKPHADSNYVINRVHERMINKEYLLEDLKQHEDNGIISISIDELKEYLDI